MKTKQCDLMTQRGRGMRCGEGVMITQREGDWDERWGRGEDVIWWLGLGREMMIGMTQGEG